MSTYAIGDIQGCYTELQQLLQLVGFKVTNDYLWFVGDLVNRGPASLEVLRFVKQLDNAVIVLGNHDLHLLALYYVEDPFLAEHNLQSVLQAPDCAELMEWLRQQPLLHYDSKLNYVMTHAGIYPKWSLTQARRFACEIETELRGDNCIELLQHMYGNKPACWVDDLVGYERQRFIINSFVRMRFCDLRGNLNLVETGNPKTVENKYLPWYQIPWRQNKEERIIFGHWAALEGTAVGENIYALDTGCVWGGALDCDAA